MNDVYKFEMDLDTEAELLKGSGKYSFSLMLGKILQNVFIL